MNKLKLLISFIFAFALLSMIPSRAMAVDLTVICQNDGPCDMAPNPGDALFDVTNMLPGDSVTQTITATNEDDDESCNLVMEITDSTQNPSNFPGQLSTTITRNSTNIFGPGTSFQDLYDTSSVDFGSIDANQTANFSWSVTFDSSSGNEFQLAQTVFDFQLSFVCDTTSTSTTSTSSSSSSDTSSSDSDSSSGQVLGASTELLPATGANLSWIIFASFLLATGTILFILGTKKRGQG